MQLALLWPRLKGKRWLGLDGWLMLSPRLYGREISRRTLDDVKEAKRPGYERHDGENERYDKALQKTHGLYGTR